MAADGGVGPLPAAGGVERPVLLAFVTDAESESMLRDALLGDVGEGADIRRGDLQAAARTLRKGVTPRTLVVDVSGLEQPLSALEELAQVVEPDVRVLVIGDRTDAAFYRQLTRGLGVLEYLHKPLGQEMLARHFMPVIKGAAGVAPELYLRGGRVVAVVGARGGAGSTSIAGNLAWHLAERSRRHTVLLDGDLHAAGAALLLGARTTNGLRVALEHPDRVDELFVERTAQPVSERLFVLAAEEALFDGPRMAPGALPRLMDTLRRRFNFVVVDLPLRAGPLAREVLDLAHQRVLVADPTLLGTREMLRFAALPGAPMQARRAFKVINRMGQPGTLSREQVKQALGEDPDLVIPWLPKLVAPAADLGNPAAGRRGAFRDAIERLSHEIASSSGRPPAKPGLLQRIFR